jgi:hypothetical protein
LANGEIVSEKFFRQIFAARIFAVGVDGDLVVSTIADRHIASRDGNTEGYGLLDIRHQGPLKHRHLFGGKCNEGPGLRSDGNDKTYSEATYTAHEITTPTASKLRQLVKAWLRLLYLLQASVGVSFIT